MTTEDILMQQWAPSLDPLFTIVTMEDYAIMENKVQSLPQLNNSSDSLYFTNVMKIGD